MGVYVPVSEPMVPGAYAFTVMLYPESSDAGGSSPTEKYTISEGSRRGFSEYWRITYRGFV